MDRSSTRPRQPPREPRYTNQSQDLVAIIPLASRVLDDLPLVGGEEEDNVHMFLNNQTAVQSLLGSVNEDESEDANQQVQRQIHWASPQRRTRATQRPTKQPIEDSTDDFPLVSADEGAVFVAKGVKAKKGTEAKKVVPKRVSVEQKTARAQARARGEDSTDDFPLVSADEGAAFVSPQDTGVEEKKHGVEVRTQERGSSALQRVIGKLKHLVELLDRGDITDGQFLARKAELLGNVQRVHVSPAAVDIARLDTGKDCGDGQEVRGRSKATSGRIAAVKMRTAGRGAVQVPTCPIKGAGRFWDDSAFTRTLQEVADRLAEVPRESSQRAPPASIASAVGQGREHKSWAASPATTQRSNPNPARTRPPPSAEPLDDSLFLLGPLDFLTESLTSVGWQRAVRLAPGFPGPWTP